MKALQLLFYFKPISSVAAANISKLLLPLLYRRVNRSQARMRFLILYTLSASCRVRDTRAVTKTMFSPSIAHANSADAFISLLLKLLGTLW